MKPEFTFDPETHTYRLNGAKLPSVTQIIKEVFGVREWWSDYYADRGTALHLAIHYQNRGVLDVNSIDPAIQGRLDGFNKFLNENIYKVVESEFSGYSKKYRYAGTFDLCLSDNLLGDIKSSFDPTVFIQLGAYALLSDEYSSKFNKAVAIILNDNGTYNLKWIKTNEMRYWKTAFLNTLSVYNLKQKHHI